MIVLTAMVAALYAAAYFFLAPFSLHLIPGVLTFTIRTVFIMAFGIFFGPAGAWGAGIGNAVGDFLTNSLAFGSIFGFLTNFLVAYLGHTLWTRYGAAQRGPAGEGRPAPSRRLQATWYLAIGLVAAAVGAITLAWGLNLLGLAPFKLVGLTLFLNLLIGNGVGGLLYLALYTRIKAIGMTWDSIMSPEEIGRPINPSIGLVLVTVGGLAGYAISMLMVDRTDVDLLGGAFVAVIILGALFL